MTSRVVVHEAGHALVGLMTGRRVVEVWVEFEPFCWFPGGVARIRRGLAVDVAGYLAEDLAAGVERERLSRRLAGGYSGPVWTTDPRSGRRGRSAPASFWTITTPSVSSGSRPPTGGTRTSWPRSSGRSAGPSAFSSGSGWPS